MEFSSPTISAGESLSDGLVPEGECDRSVPFCQWHQRRNSTEWASYTFAEPTDVRSCVVYWYDDQPWGECQMPRSWAIYFQDEAGQWSPVSDADAYPIKKGEPCIVNFAPVRTKALKLEFKLPEQKTSAIFEWEVR